MKRIVLLLLAALSISFFACKNDSQLKEMVREMNKICPIDMGEWMTMENVTYDNKTVTMTYTVEEGMIDFDGVRANEEAFRNNMLVGYANNTEQEFNMLLDAIVKAKADLCLVVNSEDGDGYSMQFSYDELKANRAGENANPEALLITMAENTRLQTPQIVDDGLVMTDVTIDAKYYTYVYSCDEADYDINFMNGNIASVKEEILKGFSEDNSVMRSMFDLLKATNRGLAFKYVGSSSGKVCVVCLEPYEL